MADLWLLLQCTKSCARCFYSRTVHMTINVLHCNQIACSFYKRMWMWSQFACSQMHGLWSFSSVLIAQNVKTTNTNFASRHRYWETQGEKESNNNNKKRQRTSSVAVLAHNHKFDRGFARKPIYIYLKLAKWSIRHVRCVRVSSPNKNWFYSYHKKSEF